MLNKTRILDIVPPEKGEKKEGQVEKIRGFKCPTCKGLGYLIIGIGKHGSEKGEGIKNDCSRCDKTGKLYADIVIRWMPDINITE